MKKSSLFISGILTTFILTVMAGTISAYRAYAASASQPTRAGLTSAAQPTAQPAPVASTSLSPQEGAQLAASYLGRSDLNRVESGYLYGLYVYKVIFSNGDAAYVSLDGQILRIEPAAPAGTSSTSGATIYGGYDD